MTQLSEVVVAHKYNVFKYSGEQPLDHHKDNICLDA